MDVEVLTAQDTHQAELPLSVYNPLEALFSAYRSKHESILQFAAHVAGMGDFISHFIKGNDYRLIVTVA